MLKKLLFVLALLPSFVFAQTNLSQGGTGWTSSTVGQLLVGTSSTLRYSRLDVGSAGTVLQASSTSPFRMAWVTLASIFDSLLSSNNTWTGTNTFNATTTLNKVVAGTSAGLQFFSNGLTQVADFGAGGGSNASFLGGVNVTGDLAVDTNTLYVDTTNNRVGVGTTTPGFNLTVSGSDATIAVSNSGGSASFLRMFNAGTQRFVIDARSTATALSSLTAPLTFNTSSTERMRIDNSGNVGIGTTTPTSQLSIVGSAGTGAPLQGGVNGATLSLLSTTNGVGDGGAVVFGTATGPNGFAGIKGFLQTGTANTAGDLAFYTRRFTSDANLTESMRILYNGNIGIGTTSPGTSLTVGAGGVNQIPNGAGSNFTPQISNSQTSGVAGISVGVTDGTNNRRAGIFVNQTNGLWGLSTTYTSGAIPFVINEAGTERLRIDTSGNVGIGTTTPVAPLTVYSTSTSGTSPVFMVATTTPIIRAQANGRVGIGSNVGTPSAPLHIFTPVANSTTVTGQYIVNAGSGAGAGAELLLGYAATAAGSGGIASFYDTSHFNGTVGVKTRLSAGGTTFLTGSVTGDVGIGTTTPSARLAIQGTSGSTTPLFSIASSSGTINPILQVIPVATYGGFVGINAPTPTYQLEISSDANSTGRGLLIGQHSADVGAAVITAQKSRGTRSSPTTVVSGDYTFAFAGQSYDGSAYRNTANFGYRTSGTIASNSIPGQWFFAATSSNDTNPYTNGTVRMVIGSDGNVGIGTTTPNSVLTIASSTTSTSTSILNIFNSLSTPIMRILGSGAVLFGTITTANCGNAPCGLTVATTTQFTAGTVARVVGYSSAASTTINLDTTDIATTTIDRATTFVNPTGTAYDGSMFEIRAKATTTQTVYWDTAFASSTDLTNVSSVASGTTRFLFEYRQDVGKWELVGKLGQYIN